VGETLVGVAGELLPSVAVDRDLPRRVGVVQLDLDALITLGSSNITAHTIAVFPAATQDLSVVVDEAVPAGVVRDVIVEGAGALLELAELVDDYRGAGLAPGTKSLTLALRFRSPDRTLTAAEATEAKLAGLALASERLGATLRA
jgi:phenylalanyl-tRNA synthetase beta chain